MPAPLTTTADEYFNSLRQSDSDQTDEHFSRIFTSEDRLNELADDPVIRDARKHSLLGDELPKVAANNAFLSKEYGRDISPMEYEAARDGYAGAKFGKSSVTDGEFFGLVRGQYEWKAKKNAALNDLHARVVARTLEDTLAGRDVSAIAPVFREWGDANPELRDGDNDLPFLAGALRLHRKTLADIESVRVPAAAGLDVLRKFTDGKAADTDVLEFAKTLSLTPPQDRQKAYKYIALGANAGHVDRSGLAQFAKNFGEAVSRSFDFLPQGDLQMKEIALRNRIEALKTQPVWIPKDIPDAIKRATFGESPDIGYGSADWRPATPEEVTGLLSEAESAAPVFSVVRELRDVAKSGVDPSRPVFNEDSLAGTIERGAIGLAGSTGLMTATAINPMLGVMAYQATEYDRIMLENPEIDPGFAQSLALVEGAGNAALDRLQIKAITGRLPILGNLLDRVKTSGWRRALKVGGNIVEQNVQEGAQDLIAPVLESITAAIREDMPDKDFKKLMADYVGGRAETFFAVLPLALIGGGVATVQDIKDPARVLTADALRQAGCSEEQRADIQSATSEEEFRAKIEAQWKKRTPENIAAGKAEIEASADAAKRQQESVQDPTLESTLQPDGTFLHTALRSDGSVILQTPDLDAAQMAISEEISVSLSGEKSVIRDLFTHFENKPWVKFEEVANLPTVQARLAELENEGDAEGVKKLWERVRFAGHEGTNPANLDIRGETTIEQVSEMVYRGAVKLAGDATPAEFFEETNHAFTRTKLANGEVTLDQLGKWLEQTEAVTGQPVKRGNETEIIESVADVAVKYAHGDIADSQLPQSFKDYVVAFLRVAKESFLHAVKAIRAGFKSGEMDSDFEAFLAESTGLPVQKLHNAGSDRIAAELVGGPDYSISIRADLRAFMDGEPVSLLSGSEFEKIPGESLIDRVAEWYEANHGGVATSPEIGPVILNKRGVSDSLAHGIGRNKAAAFAAVPDIISKGKVLHEEKNWKGRGYDSTVIGAPIRIGDTDFVAVVLVHKGQGIQRFYLHEVGSKKGLQQSAFKTGASADESVEPSGAPVGAIKKILRDIFLVNPGPDLSISTKEDRQAVAEKLKSLNKKPGERLAIYERAKALFDRVKDGRAELDGAKGGDAKYAKLLQSLRELDAILKVLPPEIRGKVGGYTTIAKIGQDTKSGPGVRQVDKFLEKRIAMIGTELERYLNKEYRGKIERLVAAARPKKGDNGVRRSTLGDETQKFADKVYFATLMDSEATAKALELKGNQLEAATPEEAVDLAEEWSILNTFGDLQNRNSETLAQGVEWLKTQFAKGRSAWRISEQARIDGWREKGNAIESGLGTKTRKGVVDQNQKGQLATFIERFRQFGFTHQNFEGFMRALLPVNAQGIVEEWSTRMRKADNGAQDMEIKGQQDLLNVIRAAAKAEGITTGKALADLKFLRMGVVEALTGRTVTNERFTVEQAEAIVRGEADAGKLKKEDIENLRDELASRQFELADRDFDQMMAGNDNARLQQGSKYVQIQRVINAGFMEKLNMSRGEAMHILLCWNQPDVQEKMRREGWTNDSAAQCRDLISDPISQSVYNYLLDFYGKSASVVNPVYSRIFGMGIPQVKNYAPTRYDNAKDSSEIGPDGVPVSGSTAPSFTKSRVSHSASLKVMDALTVYREHVAQQAHWVNFAELAREVRGVTSNPDVRGSIMQAHGKLVLEALDDWISLMEKRGGNRSREIAWQSSAMHALVGGKAVSALGNNLKTILMQVDSGIRFMAAVDSKDWVTAFSDPAALFASMPDVWNSPSVQRRIKGGANPEVQFLYSSARAKPGAVSNIASASTLGINYGDAVFTTISSAVVFRASYARAIEAGAPEKIATDQALDAVDAAIYRLSQPVGFGAKSLMENSGNSIFKGIMLFMSDPRLKTGIILDAVHGIKTGKGDKGTHIRRIAAVEFMALVSHFIACAYRDAFTDDDDEEIYSVAGMIRALALAPLQGFFLAGAMLDSVSQAMIGQGWWPRNNVPGFYNVEHAMKAAQKTENLWNPDDAEAMFKEWDHVARAVAVTPAMAAPAVLLNPIKPLLGLSKNIENEE